jgi:hypothetical protein
MRQEQVRHNLLHCSKALLEPLQELQLTTPPNHPSLSPDPARTAVSGLPYAQDAVGLGASVTTTFGIPAIQIRWSKWTGRRYLAYSLPYVHIHLIRTRKGRGMVIDNGQTMEPWTYVFVLVLVLGLVLIFILESDCMGSVPFVAFQLGR